MGLKHSLVATCDTCMFRQKINPNTTQPFLALSDMGWTLNTTTDEVGTICPVCSGGDENHGTVMLARDGFVWLFNAHSNVWICTDRDTWNGDPKNLAGEASEILRPRNGGSVYVGFDAGAHRIIDEDGVVA